MENLKLLLAGAVIVGVVGLAWMWQTTEQQAANVSDARVDTEPDVFAQAVEFHQLQPDGSLHYRLRAANIRQYDLDQLTRMAQPQLHLVSAAQPPWDVASRHGYIRKRTSPTGTPEDVVYLREKVELVQSHPENGLVTMRSESFYIYPGREFAETDQDVMIDTQVGRTKAAGLRADLTNGVLNLSSAEHQRVHTIVLPEQFKKG